MLLFTEAHNMFRREVRKFGQEVLAPGIIERARQRQFPRDLVRQMATIGLLGLNIPEKYEGQGSDAVTTGIAMEEIGRADSDATLFIVLSAMAGSILARAPEKVQQDWLPKIAQGEKVICLAVTEPEAGSDVGAMKATAVRQGDHYIINADKNSATLGLLADACIAFAKTDPQARIKGISCFLVPFDLPTISRSIIPDLGWESIGRGDIALADVSVPTSHLIGEEGKGFFILMEYFDTSRVLLTLAVLGSAQASLEEAVTYAGSRTAFGQPISSFQGVSFKLAEQATLVEAARLLCYQTLCLIDQGLPHTKEAAMCKWFGAKTAINAILEALLVHGHYGYSQELPLSLRLKNAVGFDLAYGTGDIMKVIIARELTKGQ